MLSPDLHSLGFDFSEWNDLKEAILNKKLLTVVDVGPFKGVSLYQDESDAAIGLFGYKEDPVCTTPSLRGVAGYHVKGYQIYPALALLEVYDSWGENTHRLFAFVDDPHCYPIYDFEKQQEVAEYEDYRFSAVALDVTVYPSVDEWEKHQTPLGVSNSFTQDSAEEMFIGPTFMTSLSLFSLSRGECASADADATTWFKAVVKNAELRINNMTGQKWWRCEADSGLELTVALPADIQPEPKAGSVIDGYVLLLGSSGYWEG